MPLAPAEASNCTFGDDSCCKSDNLCDEGEGDCDSDSDCLEGLECGRDNCPYEGDDWDYGDDCCYDPLGKRCRVVYK